MWTFIPSFRSLHLPTIEKILVFNTEGRTFDVTALRFDIHIIITPFFGN